LLSGVTFSSLLPPAPHAALARLLAWMFGLLLMLAAAPLPVLARQRDVAAPRMADRQVDGDTVAGIGRAAGLGVVPAAQPGARARRR